MSRSSRKWFSTCISILFGVQLRFRELPSFLRESPCHGRHEKNISSAKTYVVLVLYKLVVAKKFVVIDTNVQNCQTRCS